MGGPLGLEGEWGSGAGGVEDEVGTSGESEGVRAPGTFSGALGGPEGERALRARRTAEGLRA